MFDYLKQEVYKYWLSGPAWLSPSGQFHMGGWPPPYPQKHLRQERQWFTHIFAEDFMRRPRNVPRFLNLTLKSD